MRRLLVRHRELLLNALLVRIRRREHACGLRVGEGPRSREEEAVRSLGADLDIDVLLLRQSLENPKCLVEYLNPFGLAKLRSGGHG